MGASHTVGGEQDSVTFVRGIHLKIGANNSFLKMLLCVSLPVLSPTPSPPYSCFHINPDFGILFYCGDMFCVLDGLCKLAKCPIN